MLGKNLLEDHSPVTQSVKSVKALLAYVGRASDPLPSDVSLENGHLILVLSNKKDAYYTCTARACSCPGNQFRHNCKHMRRYFPQEQPTATKPTASEPLIKRGGFRPIDTLPGEEKASSTPLYVDCTPDVTSREIAYHSIREDKTMWPLEA